MTSLYLLLWIALAILLQVAVYLSVGFFRHWRTYQALRDVALELHVVVRPDAVPATAKPATAAWAGFRPFRVDRKALKDAAGEVCSFYLVPVDGKPLEAFLPGQFLTFALDVPDAQNGALSVIRCYSLSDAPQPSHYRISVKRAAAPPGSSFPAGIASNFLHDHMAVGSLMQVRAPAGHFHMDRSDGPVVLIGGGIGVTPLLSMLTGCLKEQPGREIWLFYGVRNPSELVMQAQLRAWAGQHPSFHLHLCLSDPQPGDLDAHPPGLVQHHHSRVNVALLRRLLPLKPYRYYICGPTAMLQSLLHALDDWGVPDGRIHFEAFGPASIPRKNAAAASATATQGDDRTSAVQVTFAKSGRQETWEPSMGSLLSFAENHGVVVSSGCRAGACGTCQTGIRAGEVTYTQAPDFDPEPGSCLLCVCTPKTAVTLEA